MADINNNVKIGIGVEVQNLGQLESLNQSIIRLEDNSSELQNTSKSLRTQLRDTINEMSRLKEGSQAFLDAAKRAAQLRERISDTNDVIKAFNPEQKFKAFEGVIGGVANGFSAAQGAIALFGSENQKLEEIMVRTQAAMAIAQGVNGLLGLKDAFNILSTVIKTEVITAFNSLKIIMLENPITAIAVVLGTAAAAWIAYTNSTDAATTSQKEYNTVGDETINKIDGEIQKLKERNDELLIELDLKRQGKGSDEVRLVQLNNEIKAQEDLVNKYKENNKNRSDYNELTDKNIIETNNLINKLKLERDEVQKGLNLKKEINNDTKKEENKNIVETVNLLKQENDEKERLIRITNQANNYYNNVVSKTNTKTSENSKKLLDTILNSWDILGDKSREILIGGIENIKNYPDTIRKETLLRLKENLGDFDMTLEGFFEKYPATAQAAFEEVSDEFDNLYSDPIIQSLDILRDAQDEEVSRFKLSEKEKLEFFYMTTNERTEFIKKKQEQDKIDFKIEQDTFEKRKQLYTDLGNSVSNTFNSLSTLAKEGSAEQQALANAAILTTQGVALANAAASAFSPLSADNATTGGLAGAVKIGVFVAQLTSLFATIASMTSTANNTYSSTEPRKFAKGGILQGPSHSMGGIQTPFGELEGNEIILNKNVTKNKAARTIASKLNKQNGGVDFANNGSDVIRVEIANPQYLKAEVSDRKLTRKSKSF